MRSWDGVVTRGLEAVNPVVCSAKISETTLEATYGKEVNIQSSGNISGGHSSSKHANCLLVTLVALRCATKLHILEWLFIVPSIRCTCVTIMFFNQHLAMPHLSGGWIILAKRNAHKQGFEQICPLNQREIGCLTTQKNSGIS